MGTSKLGVFFAVPFMCAYRGDCSQTDDAI